MKKEYFVIIIEIALYLSMLIMGIFACAIIAIRGQEKNPFIIGFFSIGLILIAFLSFVEIDTGDKFIFCIGFVYLIFTLFVFGFFKSKDIYAYNNTPEVSASYEITVNEKTFKISDFKTKVDGSIEFTADDGTIIHASTYELRKLNQETEETKNAGRKTQ